MGEATEMAAPARVDIKPKITANAAEAEPKPPRKRPDGRWDCNHLCRDKRGCKHMWSALVICSLFHQLTCRLLSPLAAAVTGKSSPAVVQTFAH